MIHTGMFVEEDDNDFVVIDNHKILIPKSQLKIDGKRLYRDNYIECMVKFIESIYKNFSPFWFNIFEEPEKHDLTALSAHKNLKFEIIYAYQTFISHEYFPWNWKTLSWNPHLRWDHIINNMNSASHAQDYNSKEEPDGISIKGLAVESVLAAFIISFEKEWDWGGISRNPFITIDMVKRGKHLNWDFVGLFQNPNVYPQLPNE